MRVDYHVGSKRYITIRYYPSKLGAMFGDAEDASCTVLDVCARTGVRHELCSDMFAHSPTPMLDLNEHALDDNFHTLYSMLGVVQLARIEHPELTDVLDVWQREVDAILHRRTVQRHAATH